MKTLLQVIEQKSNFTSNLGLKFWWWALETIIHRFYSEEFENKIFTRPKLPIKQFGHKQSIAMGTHDFFFQIFLRSIYEDFLHNFLWES
jgi:hypothetical protein